MQLVKQQTQALQMMARLGEEVSSIQSRLSGIEVKMGGSGTGAGDASGVPDTPQLQQRNGTTLWA